MKSKQKVLKKNVKIVSISRDGNAILRFFFIAPQGEAIELITASLRLKRIIKLADHLNHQNENNQQILTLAIQHPSAQISEREAGAGV